MKIIDREELRENVQVVATLLAVLAVGAGLVALSAWVFVFSSLDAPVRGLIAVAAVAGIAWLIREMNRGVDEYYDMVFNGVDNSDGSWDWYFEQTNALVNKLDAEGKLIRFDKATPSETDDE